jgi:hypothetical protein
MNEENKDKEKYWTELVLAKLEVMPQDYKLSVGDQGIFNKTDLMDHVERGDPIGKQFIEMQKGFMKALTSGELTKVIAQ